MKRSIVLALASVPMVLATGMASTAHATDDTEGSGNGKVQATVYVGDPVDLVPGENVTARVQCPTDATAVGGGGFTNTVDAATAYLTDSYPIDAGGAPAAEGTSATGWSVSATHAEPGASLTAYVVCHKKKSD